MDVGMILAMGEDQPVTYRSIRDLARAGEDGGLASLWVYDHLLSVEGDRVSGQWEAWSVLSALAATTSTAQLGILVSCNSFRHPALHAKMAHTVQEISAGRLILGLGAGWHEPEYRAFGFPFDRRVARFAEGIEVIARLLRGERVTFDGRFYQLADAELLPPLSDGPIPLPILVGARGDRMLRLTARWADAWNTAWYGLPNERFDRVHERWLAACAAQGRDPATVAVTVGMIIGGQMPERVVAEPAAVADALAVWRDRGVAHVICWVDPTDRAGVALLIAGVRAFRT